MRRHFAARRVCKKPPSHKRTASNIRANREPIRAHHSGKWWGWGGYTNHNKQVSMDEGVGEGSEIVVMQELEKYTTYQGYTRAFCVGKQTCDTTTRQCSVVMTDRDATDDSTTSAGARRGAAAQTANNAMGSAEQCASHR